MADANKDEKKESTPIELGTSINPPASEAAAPEETETNTSGSESKEEVPAVKEPDLAQLYGPDEHPEPGVIVLCELDGYLAPAERPFVKGQWDDHANCFFTTVNSHYEKLNVNRWLELK